MHRLTILGLAAAGAILRFLRLRGLHLRPPTSTSCRLPHDNVPAPIEHRDGRRLHGGSPPAPAPLAPPVGGDERGARSCSRRRTSIATRPSLLPRRPRGTRRRHEAADGAAQRRPPPRLKPSAWSPSAREDSRVRLAYPPAEERGHNGSFSWHQGEGDACPRRSQGGASLRAVRRGGQLLPEGGHLHLPALFHRRVRLPAPPGDGLRLLRRRLRDRLNGPALGDGDRGPRRFARAKTASRAVHGVGEYIDRAADAPRRYGLRLNLLSELTPEVGEWPARLPWDRAWGQWQGSQRCLITRGRAGVRRGRSGRARRTGGERRLRVQERKAGVRIKI